MRLAALLTLWGAYSAESVAIRDRLYKDIHPRACVRLFHSGGVVGCGSGVDGSLGALYGVTSDAELIQFETSSIGDRAILLAPNLLRSSVIERLGATGKVTAVLVANDSTAEMIPYSPDPAGLWNPHGDGLAATHVPFPVALLSSGDTAHASELVEGNRAVGYSGEPQGVVEFNFYMGPDEMDSVRCLQLQKCKPLGGSSVWGVMGALPDDIEAAETSREVVLAATALDSTALFHDDSFGADAGISGIVTLLGAAQALGAQNRTTVAALRRQIAFGFFQAEAWGHVGSRRFVHDTAVGCAQLDAGQRNESCELPQRRSLEWMNMPPRRISHVIAVEQLAGGSDGEYFVHATTSPASEALADLVVQRGAAPDTTPEATLRRAGAGAAAKGLPPSAANAYVEAPGGWGGAAVVLAGFDEAYTNTHFHSRFDRAPLDAARITAVATTLARSLVEIAQQEGGQQIPVASIKADHEFVAALARQCANPNVAYSRVTFVSG